MIKTTIIIILILLLFVTLYSYYCLSSRMINFERERLEYILKKDNELKTMEKNIKVISDCSNKNEKYKKAIQNINLIIEKLNFDSENIHLAIPTQIPIESNLKYNKSENVSNTQINNQEFLNNPDPNDNLNILDKMSEINTMEFM